MLYRVLKGAVGPDLIAEIERTAGTLKSAQAQTLEHDEEQSRSCEVCWILQRMPVFRKARKAMFEVLEREGVIDPRLCALENLQYTVYRPGGFHDWHVDAYRRSYNMYDMGREFIGKKRKISISILLNDASAFTGGAFEVSLFPNGRKTVGSRIENFSEAGDLALFESSLCHRVAPVESGVRKSLVGWICA